MAVGEFYIEHQNWARFPKVVHVCRKRGYGGIERKRYVPERTCHKVVGKYGHRWSCSECDGTLLPGYPSTRYPDGIVHYCPNCGAKMDLEGE